MVQVKPAPTEKTSKAAPVRASERIEFVDILRGFALFGVLAANMASFIGQSSNFQTFSGTDRIVVILIRFLIQAKFYSLFSLLFGWGMAMQMRRAEAKGVRFAPLFLRRLVILLIFGVLHGFFIWRGDILTTYALFGFLLLLFRKRSEKVILAAAGLALLLSIVLTVPGDVMDGVRTGYENLTAFLRSDTRMVDSYGTGSYVRITQSRIQEFLTGHSYALYYFGNVFAMFLLGLYFGKRRIFQDVDRHLPSLRKVTAIGLVIGVVFNGIFVWTMVAPEKVPGQYYRLIQVGARTIGAPALMLFYVSGIILLLQKKAWRRRLEPLANLGRMALSNYLSQSVVCTLIFYGYGLGVYGDLGPTAGLILTIVIYSTQIRISRWWLDSYRFGPMEWLWRTLTYGKRQPMRVGVAYAGLEPTQRPSRIRRMIARVDPKIALAGAWVLLLLWAGGLFAWYGHLERDKSAIDLSALQVKATPTPSAAQADQTTDQQPGMIATPVVQPVPYNPSPVAASGDLLNLASTFNADSALAQIETLTSPPYLGRYAGSPEGQAAGDYIAGQFASYGLQPAGYDGTFFQPFPVEYVALAEEPSLMIEGPDGTLYDRYVLHQDFSAVAGGYAGGGRADGEVVWANNCTHADLDQVLAEGKILLCRDGSVEHSTRNALEHGAAGLLLLTDPELRPPDFGDVYFESWVPEPIPTLRVYPEVVQGLLLGSDKSVNDLSVNFESFPLQTRAQIQVQTMGCAGEVCEGRNVLGVIPGRDPEYAGQVIILGAHYDHFGQAPDGTAWVGANNDASGLAVLLEMARSWHESGYVPRHTVLFAAWDANEMGLLGSQYYVEHPRYPLENTLAQIQLDMVGAGADTLSIDGEGELGAQLHSIASALGVETRSTDSGNSDHGPFLDAGTSANALTWFAGAETMPHYNRPTDTLEVIEIDRLAAVGKIAELSVLGLTEGAPDIAHLLDRRAAAVEQGDLPAFLATSLPEEETADRFWFTDVQTFAPTRFEMQASDVRVLGRTATATVDMTLEYPQAGEETETQELDASLSVKFVYGEDGWRWAGPNLLLADPAGRGFAVAYPPDVDPLDATSGLDGLGQQAAGQYTATATLLGLPTTPDATLLLFPSAESLRVSTALSLPPREQAWVEPGRVKLVYSPEISASLPLADKLAELALAEAGVTEAVAPWLWRGLPLALSGQDDIVATHARYIPDLRRDLAAETVPVNDATSWAAVDYLRRQRGWQGVGEFITALGGYCQVGLCESTDAVTAALHKVFQMNAAAFETAWQNDWRERLTAAQTGLDALLATRAEAVLNGDEAAFLNTVDPDVPHLVAEERNWFADLAQHSIEEFTLTAEPMALLEDGRVLATVDLQYDIPDLSASQSEASVGVLRTLSVSLRTIFIPNAGGYRWGGVSLESLPGEGVQVLYPEGQEELALAVLGQAEAIYPQLATDLGLGIEEPEPLTIKLYASNDAFRTSVSLSFPRNYWVTAWTGKDESVKLLLEGQATPEDFYPALAVYLARHLLYQNGVDAEWLIKGASLYLSSAYDGGVTEQAAASHLADLLRAVSKGTINGLDAMPPDDQLSEDDSGLANAQAWDAVRYLAYTYGRETLTDLLRAQGRGLDLDTALQNATGQTLAEFEAAWSESLALAHTSPEWVEIALAFDPELANQHVAFLAGPELAGRLAGSPGAETAAAYIAEKFAEYGLVPVGDPLLEESAGENSIAQASSFLQRFPISYTRMLSIPALEISDLEGQTLADLAHREEFVVLFNETSASASVEGELVWVKDENVQGLDLEGKIALFRASGDIDTQVAQATGAGADGLILIGEIENVKQSLAKFPLPVRFPSADSIPVLELTKFGYEHLLELAGLTPPDLQNSPPALPFGVQVRIEIAFSPPQTVQTANVLGWLPGADPVMGQEVVILSAHYDHVGDDPGSRRYAGANDDASGVAVLLEIARLWQETGYRPQRSVLFAAWSAQELGEQGSSYYVEHPLFPLERTASVVQMDVVGGGSGHYMEAQGVREREGLSMFAMQVAEDLVDGRLKLAVPRELSRSDLVPGTELFASPFEGLAYQLLKSEYSDQVSFHRVGVPALLVTWRGANEDNWPDEIADEVEPYRLGVTGRMVTLTLMSMTR